MPRRSGGRRRSLFRLRLRRPVDFGTGNDHAPRPLHHAFLARLRGPDLPSAVAGAIEWEELPSLAGSLAKRLAAATQAPWDATRPAELEALTVPSQPFREPVNGLAIREVNEPDVFRHFFGT